MCRSWTTGMLNGFDLAYREDLDDHAYPIPSYFGQNTMEPTYYRGFKSGYNSVMKARLAIETIEYTNCVCCGSDSPEGHIADYCEDCSDMRCDAPEYFSGGCPKKRGML